MTAQTCFATLESRALIQVSDPDWRGFLHGLLTQDMETLAPGELRFAGLLTPQGRLSFDLFVIGETDGCLIDVAAARRDALIQRLTLYRLRAKVRIEPVETPVVALWPSAATAPATEWARDPRLASLGWRGCGAEPPAGATIVDEAAHGRHRLALGVPDPDRDCPPDSTYPIEANFDLLHGIDFQKGCFVGQETTSRMKRRGAIKNRMAAITFDGAPPAFGAEVLAKERRAGEVLSGQDGRAMALLRLDRAQGAALSVGGRAVKVEWPGYLDAAG